MSLFIKQTDRKVIVQVTNDNINLATATNTKILYKNPRQVKGYWEAIVNGSNLEYEVQDADDINIAGDWHVQGYWEIAGKTYYTDIEILRFVETLD